MSAGNLQAKVWFRRAMVGRETWHGQELPIGPQYPFFAGGHLLPD